MSWQRAIVKFGAAGAVTTVFVLGARATLPTTTTPMSSAAARRSRTQHRPASRREVVIVGSALVALTWVAALA